MTEDRWEFFGDYEDKYNDGVIAERKRIVTMLRHQLQTLQFELEGGNEFFAEQLNNFIFITKDYIKLIEGENND